MAGRRHQQVVQAQPELVVILDRPDADRRVHPVSRPMRPERRRLRREQRGHQRPQQRDLHEPFPAPPPANRGDQRRRGQQRPAEIREVRPRQRDQPERQQARDRPARLPSPAHLARPVAPEEQPIVADHPGADEDHQRDGIIRREARVQHPPEEVIGREREQQRRRDRRRLRDAQPPQRVGRRDDRQHVGDDIESVEQIRRVFGEGRHQLDRQEEPGLDVRIIPEVERPRRPQPRVGGIPPRLGDHLHERQRGGHVAVEPRVIQGDRRVGLPRAKAQGEDDRPQGDGDRIRPQPGEPASCGRDVVWHASLTRSEIEVFRPDRSVGPPPRRPSRR